MVAAISVHGVSVVAPLVGVLVAPTSSECESTFIAGLARAVCRGLSFRLRCVLALGHDGDGSCCCSASVPHAACALALETSAAGARAERPGKFLSFANCLLDTPCELFPSDRDFRNGTKAVALALCCANVGCSCLAGCFLVGSLLCFETAGKDGVAGDAAVGADLLL